MFCWVKVRNKVQTLDAYVRQVHEMGMISGMNGVAMAPHGLILSQDEATASRNLSKHLPALWDTIFGSKRTQINTKHTKN